MRKFVKGIVLRHYKFSRRIKIIKVDNLNNCYRIIYLDLNSKSVFKFSFEYIHEHYKCPLKSILKKL